jgi:putative transposase
MAHSTPRTIYFASQLPRTVADALNAESGRIYTQVLVEQYRIYRKKGVWLSPNAQERYNDFLNTDRSSLLHSHSIDAAQQGFHKACKTAKANRHKGAHYPHHRKRYRTTVWKKSGIRVNGETLWLSLARGLEPIQVELPASAQGFAPEAYTEMRLVYNQVSRHHEWHLVIDEGVEVKPTTDTGVAAVDLGEVHPAALSDGVDACVVSCRELRSVVQHTHKRLAKFQQAQSKHQRGSRRWRRLQAKKARFLAKQAHRRRDLEHKVSRAVVDWAQEHHIGTLAIGDVRDVANGKRLNRNSQQKISSWSHGKMTDYIGYKAKAVGITVVDNVNEAYTSQTCACCGHRYKPKGRVYTCPACGAVVHRDTQGATNILSRFLHGELAQIPVPDHTTYRHPFDVTGKRSPGGHPASCSDRAP